MFKYIILCLCVSLSSILCDLNKEEGTECEWNGVKGKCIKETSCLTTLDTRGEQHLVCSKKGDETIICCTDCETVNNTNYVVMSPKTGYFWKDGQAKARDNCLDYIKELPYRCHDGGFYSGISSNYDEEKKCHTIGLWGIGGSPPPGYKPGAKYPHQALLGYGEDLQTAKWQAGGSIISDRYILTAAHVNTYNDGVKFIALGVEKRSDSTAWQTHKVKRFIPHPDYKAPSRYHDIALIETETPITFNKNVLPACLHVEAADDEKAIATTWKDLEDNFSKQLTDTIQTINLEKFTEEECKAAYAPHRTLQNSIDYNTQMCYGSRSNAPEACRGLSGEPLLIDTQFSCTYAIIGVTSFGAICGAKDSTPDVFTRVAHYRPWIESVVWP